MTKREKILLQICIAVGVIGLSVIYLLRPAISEKQRLNEELEAAQLQELQITTILDAPNVPETLKEQKELAEKNYEYFYGKLNSYTIDGIVNELVADCGLDVQSMNIGEYVEVDTTTLEREEEPETLAEVVDTLTEDADAETETDTTTTPVNEQLLLGCHVTITVEGSYDQLLKFVDELKAESTCIEVTSVSLYANERNVEDEQAVQASLGLLVYGISDAGLEGEDE